jgi:hypothetical protein
VLLVLHINEPRGARAGPVPVQMWQWRAQSRRRCGRLEPSPGADVAGVSPVPAQMWLACSACSCALTSEYTL